MLFSGVEDLLLSTRVQIPTYILNLGCLHPVARVISYDIGFIIPSTRLSVYA
jgi:hypothetical protein